MERQRHLREVSRATIRAIVCMLAGSWIGAGPVDARVPCADLALVLAIDVSGSIDATEYDLQLDGYRSALASPAVRNALADAGRVEIGALLWGDDAMPRTVIPMRLLDHASALDRFAHDLRSVGRRTWGNTGLATALAQSLDLLLEPDHCADRRLVNVSGDGRASTDPRARSRESPETARARAAREGVTINALAILNEDPDLADYYRTRVIAGPGAFVMQVEDFRTFEEALIRKLVREIAPAAVASRVSTQGRPRG